MHTPRAKTREEGRLAGTAKGQPTRLQIPGLPGAREGKTLLLAAALPAPPRTLNHRSGNDILPLTRPASAPRVAMLTALQQHAHPTPARVRVLRAVFRPRVRAPGWFPREKGMSSWITFIGMEQFPSRINNLAFPSPRRDSLPRSLLRYTRTDPSACKLRSVDASRMPLCPRRECGVVTVLPLLPRGGLEFRGSRDSDCRSTADVFRQRLLPQSRQQLRVASKWGLLGGGGEGGGTGEQGEGTILQVKMVPQHGFDLYFSNHG